jgi:hypothetical protein
MPFKGSWYASKRWEGRKIAHHLSDLERGIYFIFELAEGMSHYLSVISQV